MTTNDNPPDRMTDEWLRKCVDQHSAPYAREILRLRAEVERLRRDAQEQTSGLHEHIRDLAAERDAAIRDRNEFAASEVVKFAADFLDWSCSLSRLNDLRVAAAHRAAELRKAAPAAAAERAGGAS